jgi:hypothetical protein
MYRCLEVVKGENMQELRQKGQQESIPGISESLTEEKSE